MAGSVQRMHSALKAFCLHVKEVSGKPQKLSSEKRRERCPQTNALKLLVLWGWVGRRMGAEKARQTCLYD